MALSLHYTSSLIRDEFLNVVLCYLPDYLKLFPCNSLLFCYLFIQVAFISISFYWLLCCVLSESNPLEYMNGCLGNRFHILCCSDLKWMARLMLSIMYPSKTNLQEEPTQLFCVIFGRCHWHNSNCLADRLCVWVRNNTFYLSPRL